jgi:hypothetical protein
MNHMTFSRRVALLALLGLAIAPREAAAQLDPLLFLKRTQPTVLIGIETGNRMQEDVNGDYRDANLYVRIDAPWEPALGITALNTSRNYRRKYVGLYQTDPTTHAGDKFSADHIEIVGDRDPGYGTFDANTRISIARRSLLEAVQRNTAVARFSLFRTRQASPRYLTPATVGADKWAINEEPVAIRSSVAPWNAQAGLKWKITRPVVNTRSGDISGPVAPLVAADAAGANTSIATILKLPTGEPNSLIPAGRDAEGQIDVPLDNMLDDIRVEAQRLFTSDPECRNTVAILVVGGGEGDTTSDDPVEEAAKFLSLSGHRVPIYVAGLAPMRDADRAQLQAIATASGGQFIEITAAMVNAVAPGTPVPELVRFVNLAVSHTFANQVDFDKAPDATHPYGYGSEHQVTSPIIGSVNLENAKDIDGAALPDTIITHPLTGEKIPQRSNVLVTAGFSLPGFEGRLRAMRVYKPVTDSTKPTGYKFVSDGTRLWVASTPAPAVRNIYTALPDGTMVAFTAANAAALKPYLRTADEAGAASLIDAIRSQPLGAIVGSTPAILDAPSLDPPPDADYPGFANANKNRRSMIWVGANDGMLHGIDARLGQEVWAFIPFNLLPKLSTLRSGQPVGDFRYFMDGSPKVADVKIAGEWRTYLVIGQGSGGTFYQTFDVTLDDMGSAVTPTTDVLDDVLAYFSSAASVPLKWAFPRYDQFDSSINTTVTPWGDLAVSAPASSKTVGETWSDPAVGQIETASSKYTVLTASGFFRWSAQQQGNRGGIVAGTTFYLLDIETGDLLSSRDVGNDAKAEKVDNCAANNDCRSIKNALQADPVATGPADSRFITKAYLGDLDGRIWRFDLGLDASGVPRIKGLVSLYNGDNLVGVASEHPIFASMATVNVGSTLQYLFVGTGSDLFPRNSVNTAYALLVVQDLGTTGKLTARVKLEVTDGVGGDEKPSAFPAVAGDIVFFSTTTYRNGICAAPDANLYAFTFIGGPAYDTNGDGKVTTGPGSGADSPKLRTSTGSRATAPFIVDQHLVFGTGNKIEMFGDPEDFNNGVGQAGVRILSWREVR